MRKKHWALVIWKSRDYDNMETCMVITCGQASQIGSFPHLFDESIKWKLLDERDKNDEKRRRKKTFEKSAAIWASGDGDENVLHLLT